MSIQESAIRPPSRALAAFELVRAMAELSTLPMAAAFLRRAPKGDGHPVMALPGFTASDRSTLLLRRYLTNLGYEVHGWELGRNYDDRAIGAQGEHLAHRIETIHRATGRKVSLVGWSLGGIMAREAAHKNPDSVRQAISLGSPFAGDPSATTLRRLVELVMGQKVEDLASVRSTIGRTAPPPVPSTSIYSKSDGVVAWRNCLNPAGEYAENIEVYGSHCGLGVNPAVLYAVADRLSQPEGDWKPFDRSGWRAAFFPSSASLH